LAFAACTLQFQQAKSAATGVNVDAVCRRRAYVREHGFVRSSHLWWDEVLGVGVNRLRKPNFHGLINTG
jgi:hypothetical protein